MITSITFRDVEAAIGRLDREGIDKRRASTRFCLDMGGRHFPPKYVVSVAAEHATGRSLQPHEFSGGDETNALLSGLGLSVIACKCGGIFRSIAPATTAAPRRQSSSSRPTSTIGRVVVQGCTPDDPASMEGMLRSVLDQQWPRGQRVKFLITPGGFVRSAWPQGWAGRSAWESRGADVAGLLPTAEKVLRRVVTKRVLAAATGRTDVLTIGIDLGAERAQAELVAVFDVRSGQLVRWTGKSYPTSAQERTLVQVADLDTHFLDIADERVLLLGCHDLNMFSPRGRANQDPHGSRRKRCDAMAAKVRAFRPTVVLQHPHSTDTPNIWRMPWLSLQAATPSIRSWASGIGYYRNGPVRAPLRRVLELTRGGDECIDIVVRAKDFA